MSRQLSMDYANDPVKYKSRELLRDSIERNLLRFRKPEQLRVLCFPGVDGAEVIQVYDALGIPRENVVGLEKDPGVASVIAKKIPGIQLEEQASDAYIGALERNPFDIISFDYTGTYNDSTAASLDRLRSIPGMNWLLLHVNHIYKRDRGSYGIYECGQLTNHLVSGGKVSDSTIFKGDNDINDNIDAKLDALTNALHGNISGIQNKLYVGLLDAESPDGTLVEGCNRRLTEIFGTPIDVRDETRNADVGLFFSQCVVDYFKARLSEFRMGGYSLVNIVEAMTHPFMNQAPLELVDATRYRYISASADPMFGNIFYLNRDERFFEATRSFFESFGLPDSFVVPTGNYGGELKRINKLVSKHVEKYHPNPLDFPIVSLGSSAKPLLTKQRAQAAFEQGLTNDEIRQQFRGPKMKSLAAWRAHHTRGLKREQNNAPVVTQDTTKFEIIYLLMEGESDDQILETYPDTSKSQLAAYKAHITMGRYDREEIEALVS